jgi:probable selenium-dependent hydroxylase accessory protein YqeC
VNKERLPNRALPSGALPSTTLSEAIGLKAGMMAAAVGGGGKTSILNALGDECCAAGIHPVIHTTTTHFFAPEEEATTLLGSSERLVALIAERVGAWPHHLALARKRASRLSSKRFPGRDRMKLKGFEANEIAPFRDKSGVVLIEADGSRGLPIKAPGPHEPVLPPGVDIVLGIVGLDALGSPIDEEHVFRPERLSALCDLPIGAHVDATAIARLAAHTEGLFKNAPSGAWKYLILNKSDLIEPMEKLEQIGYIICNGVCPPSSQVEAVLFTACNETGARILVKTP